MSTPSIEQAKRIVGERVELFARNLDQYRHAEYKEAQLRVEFLDPFFEALGWDVANRQGWAEQYKEVVNEDALKAAGATRAPDYSFRIGGVRKFFVEAKKPARLIKADASAAYQLRRYAWSAKLPVSVLTDFEELAVYDCRQRPSENDAASLGRINFYTFDQYLDRLPEIYDVFSKDAVLRGSFDRFLQEAKAKRGTTPVDAEFLKEIEGWRTSLAKSIAQLNPRLGLEELNDAVQRTIDRIIFLRMAEDRGTEEYGQLERLGKGGKIYAGLLDLCQQADIKYNSGLFDFTADVLTPRLKIDDDKLSAILGDLYYPKSPYEFSVLGADTLGNVYEQFLGKVIRLTPAHLAKVEEKPEVKKAGGVYYTPTYIVDYIVKQTVGKMIEGKSPEEIETLRVLDPACGSGSFLLGAYQLLFDHHLAWYVAHVDEPGVQDRIYQSVMGWRLTTAEKKRILLNNIYGVDIDRQAVEVTKLSLLLKVLEGESQETLGKQLGLFRERALPNLDSNIKCGNSLIGPDYFAGKLLPDPDELKRVNPFDWGREFPEIMKAGGFDCVVGNPPYVLLQSLDLPQVSKHLSGKFRCAIYKIDTYQVFMEQAYRLTRQHGLVGFITPNTFLRNKFSVPLRELLLEHTDILQLRLFDYQAFSGASVDTAVTIFERNEQPGQAHRVMIDRAISASSVKRIGEVAQSEWLSRSDRNLDLPTDDSRKRIIEKMDACSNALGEFATAYFGIQTHGRGEYVSSHRVGAKWKPALDGSNIGRYRLAPPKEFVCVEPDAIKSGGDLKVYEQNRIGVRQIGQHPIATLLPGGWYSLNTIYNVFFTQSGKYELKYVLAIISSTLLGWYWERRYFDQKKTFPKVKKAPLLALPIRTINFSDPADKARHDRVVALVEQMLELPKRLHAAKRETDRELYQRQIDGTDKEIDALVYELYGLTEDEIRIVEGGG